MSLKLGTQDISGISQNTKYNAHHLLDFKWSDCIMNDVSWLRADTFSWQSGDVYVSAYNHLVADLQGTTAETETIGSYTVTFYRADDGHKICLADQEATVLNIYNESGIAWYYILDTTNTRFKLPRTKFGFEGLRNKVGDLIEAGLPNITGSVGVLAYYSQNHQSGAFYKKNQNGTNGTLNANNLNGDYGFDASLSNSIYGNSTTVQEQATQMYLYFYVGEFTQTATEQTAGLNSELFNGKADVDLTNINNTGYIKMAGAGMPSSTYVGLTLGATNTFYIAPANGWFAVGKASTGTGQWMSIVNDTSGIIVSSLSGSAGSECYLYMPCLCGDRCYVNYNLGGVVKFFRFVYAKGSESEAS